MCESYQGLRHVAPLRDVLAVLLVSHSDPLFGDHLFLSDGGGKKIIRGSLLYIKINK